MDNTGNKTSAIITTGLAIFSMFFGAGNLMYPIAVGIASGNLNFYGLSGFMLTAVMLPLIGLVSMILFDGNYDQFFSRLGERTGSIMIALCMIIIGPLIAVPRIVTISHTMIYPFIPEMSPFIFAIIFLGITFLATYRESKIVDLLGNVVSPLLLISLGIIIIKGLFTAQTAVPATASTSTLFSDSLKLGYETLDLLGAIFFSSIVITLLKKTMPQEGKDSLHKLALLGLKAGILGTSLLALIYVGLSLLGVYHGHNLLNLNAGQSFREISFNVLGGHGAIIIAIAVLMACFSTAIALAAVIAEYFKTEICHDKINFVPSLALMLLACLPLSTFGLDYVLKLTGGPITYIGYPVLIALTFCNIAYKLFGFKPVKLPVLLTFMVMLVKYFR